MPHKLLVTARKRISSGLKRSSVTICSKWAESYRIMGQPFPGKWSFKHHPWARGIHDSKAETTVGQKAAQMAYTETGLNRCFYALDVHGYSVLYILPASKPDASDFSTSRFDPALEMSPHLSNMFSDVKNIGHKRAGSANLFIRGSRSRSQLKSIPVALIIFDEEDEMVQENITLATERTSGQQHQEYFHISTPTIENYGINSRYKPSTQNHYVFRCPHCHRFTELDYDICLIVTADDINDPKLKDSHYICQECKHALDHNTKVEWLADKALGGEALWVPTYEDRDIDGFWIPQCYAMTPAGHPVKQAIAVIESQSDPTKEQELWNSKKGLPHVVAGAKINDRNIRDCTDSHRQSDSYDAGLITLGVDVGKWLHFEIDEWIRDKSSNDINGCHKPRLIREGRIKEFEELDDIILRYGVAYTVIDANPERRKALEFAKRFYGRVRMCFYGNNVKGRAVNLHSQEEHTITVDRTSWMDLALGRFKNQRISLPTNLRKEYKDHVKAPVRVYKEDADGNPVGKYITGNEADHLAHSRVYAEIALPLALGLATSHDISEDIL